MCCGQEGHLAQVCLCQSQRSVTIIRACAAQLEIISTEPEFLKKGSAVPPSPQELTA